MQAAFETHRASSPIAVYTLAPARFLFISLVCLLLSVGLAAAAIFQGTTPPAPFLLCLSPAVLLFGFGVIFLPWKMKNAAPVLTITADGLYVNFTGLGKPVFVPFENIAYAKYFSLSIEQQALGIALKDPAAWFSALSIPENAIARIAAAIEKTTINLQQNIVREPLDNVPAQIRAYVPFDDALIQQLEHPEKKKNTWLS